MFNEFGINDYVRTSYDFYGVIQEIVVDDVWGPQVLVKRLPEEDSSEFPDQVWLELNDISHP